ncbi:MAG TPA: response regulator, partial [Longimicrobiales bacterium]
LARRILERRGYRVLEAAGGPQALRLLERCAERIDLLVTDVVMPEMSGDRLAERLEALHPEAKVLFTSGHSEQEMAPRVIEGAAFLEKPFTPEMLGRKVREVLNGGGGRGGADASARGRRALDGG